jgi:hypothetical protein
MNLRIVWLQIGAVLAVAVVLVGLIYAGVVPARYIDAISFGIPLLLVVLAVFNGLAIGRSRRRLGGAAVPSLESWMEFRKRRNNRLRRWLLVSPALYIYVLWESRHEIAMIRAGFAIFGVCAIVYVYFLTRGDRQ